MSGFDENPFGEPTIDNPFEDPSVQQVTRAATNAQGFVEDYNPFANQVPPAAAPRPTTVPYQQPNNEAAVMQATQDPPAYAKSAQQAEAPVAARTPTLNTSELQRRQEELDRKEEELAKREEEWRASSYNVRRNNWPPLPEQCCFQPCFYQDIQVDIRPEFQKIVRNLYYLWIFHGCVMLVNILGGLILLFTQTDFTTLGLSILYALLFTPFSFLCWYRPAYKAFRSDSSFNFMVFFFVFFFQFVVTVIQTIGIPGSGTCGIILALKCFNQNAGDIAVGVILLIIALMFGTAAGIDLLMISKIHAIYRSSGASMAKAQQEFTTEFLRNQHVQTAATNAAAAAVQSQFNANRY